MADRILKTAQERLGYRFRAPSLLLTALTHSSYAHENRECTDNNERLEFLGDAILGSLISRILFERYPGATEGELSRYRQFLVCEDTLARVARRLSLGELLLLGNGEIRHGGREKSSILADAMEAVTAAICLDAGESGEAVTARILTPLFAEELALCESACGRDAKTRLQQFVEQGGRELLDYRVAAVQGPAHAPVYTVEALLNSNVIGRGCGHSKQEAEQQAAREALFLFGANA